MKVRDLTSGLEGILETKQYNLYSGLRVSIQPKGDGTEMKQAWTVDAVGVEILDEQPILEVEEPEEIINLGDKVRCSVTGFEGIAIARSVYLNGCVRIKIQEKYKRDGMLQQEPPQFWVDEPGLKVMPMQTEESKPNPPKQDTGGPKEVSVRF